MVKWECLTDKSFAKEPIWYTIWANVEEARKNMKSFSTDTDVYIIDDPNRFEGVCEHFTFTYDKTSGNIEILKDFFIVEEWIKENLFIVAPLWKEQNALNFIPDRIEVKYEDIINIHATFWRKKQKQKKWIFFALELFEKGIKAWEKAWLRSMIFTRRRTKLEFKNLGESINNCSYVIQQRSCTNKI